MTNVPFGKLTDTQWRHLTVYSLRQRPDGKYEMAYDPAIAELFRQTMVYADIACGLFTMQSSAQRW